MVLMVLGLFSDQRDNYIIAISCFQHSVIDSFAYGVNGTWFVQ